MKREAKQKAQEVERQKKAEERQKAKERKDAMQGCGCLLALVAIAGLLIWWWVEGFTMAALSGMWNQTTTAIGNVGLVATIGIAVGVLIGFWILFKALKGNPSEARSSEKKRGVFILLGLLLGGLGIHYAYAKRWKLFLLLWAALILGGSLNKGKEISDQNNLPEKIEVQSEESSDETTKSRGFGLSDAFSVALVALWFGGALFVKKDGDGRRM